MFVRNSGPPLGAGAMVAAGREAAWLILQFRFRHCHHSDFIGLFGFGASGLRDVGAWRSVAFGGGG